MLAGYLIRGAKAGAVGGAAFGLFTALVATPLIGAAETFESGHGAAAVPPAVAGTVSVVAGVAFGLLVGTVVFGVAYYFLEPAIPGAPDTKSYLLGAAGFVTVSGAPWLALPPQPPGVEQSLPTDVRVAWYAAMMLAGAVGCGLAGYAYNRVRARGRRRAVAALAAAAALAAVPAVAALAPANPASGAVPAGLAAAFRWTVVLGQAGTWVVLASAHAWLARRADDDPVAGVADDAVSAPSAG